jgi:hypothetical protein
MKTLLKVLGLAAFLLFIYTSCEKDDDTYCIDNISVINTMDVAEITIAIPGEQSYTGIGALPAPFKIGKYDGELSSVIIKQTITETGMEAELRHFFDDGNGNSFWTHDHAVLTPIGGSQTKFTVYDEMPIFGGTGDFECAGGMLINNADVDFETGKLNNHVTGTICGGCK